MSIGRIYRQSECNILLNAGLGNVVNARQLQSDLFPVAQDPHNNYLDYKVAVLTYPGTGQSYR